MKKVGLFFGTFNPIHRGHLVIAEYFSSQEYLDELWLVITPHSPFKKQKDLIGNHHRLAMVELAIANNPKLKACDEEFDLPTPNYSIDTLLHLKTKYPEIQFTLILGQDNIAYFDQWKDYQKILDEFEIYVYPRSQSNSPSKKTLNHPNLKFVEASLLDISSTEVRKALVKDYDLDALLPTEVLVYIRKFKCY
ncbi:MAG: nicotinate (nicotinamide) nucleotide adenylyltransferase [Flavobacteriaceae bacterium]